jgi:transposase
MATVPGPGIVDSLASVSGWVLPLSGRLERALLAVGQAIVRVPPKLMAAARQSARTPGTSDPIDALAAARTAQTAGRHARHGVPAGQAPN